MLKLRIIIFASMLSCFVKAQINIVPNGNFDDNIVCSENSYGIITAIKHWFIPQVHIVNVEKPCAYIDWWRFLKSKKIGINNSNCGFIETYYQGFPDDFIYNSQRYMAIRLSQPLIEGQEYYFEMQTKAVDTFPNGQLVNTVFTDGQDVAFVKENPIFESDEYRYFTDIRPIIKSELHKDYDWHKVSGCFTANGDEKYMIIGNFRKEAATRYTLTNKKNKNFPNGLTAYYAIDNVILTPMEASLRDTAICLGDTLKLNVFKSLPESVSYKWHTGATTPQYQTSISENIYVDIQYSKECVIRLPFKSWVITPQYQPIAQDTLVCEGTLMDFKAGVGLKGETIKWHNGSADRFFKTYQAGLYTAQVNNRCAQWIDSFRLQTRDCGEGVYIPNTFSPNDDGINDTFKPFFKSDFYPIEAYQFSIFNRWGNLIFSTQDRDEAWSGCFKNEKLPNGVYIWAITIRYKDKKAVRTKDLGGSVTLMRL